MKLAVQDGLIPGRTFGEKLDKAAEYGFEGIEIGGRYLLDHAGVVAQAIDSHPLKVSTVCAGYGGCLLDPDRRERDRAAADIRRLLELEAEVGAVGLICVPIFGPARIPDLAPLQSATDIESALLVELLGPLADRAKACGLLLLLEPLNRYETHLLNRLEEAVRLVRRVGKPGLAVMADLFHMHIEEDDLPAAIRAAGKHIRHVHLADSQRLLPGTGHTDFRTVVKALKAIGFKDYLALECGIRGRPATALAECVKFLRRQML